MRNKERIKPLLEDIEKIWIRQPDLRLSQLIQILAKTYGDFKGDLFYYEDSDLERAIEKYKRLHNIK